MPSEQIVAQPTPGPWKLVADDDGWEIHMGTRIDAFNSWEPQHVIRLDWGDTYEDEGDNSQYEEAEANATLIAAAPLLKDALEAASVTLSLLRSVILSGESWTPTIEVAYRGAQVRASAALAAARPPAAEGES